MTAQMLSLRNALDLDETESPVLPAPLQHPEPSATNPACEDGQSIELQVQGSIGTPVAFELAGRSFEIHIVDGRVPAQLKRRPTDRPRFVYTDKEVAHFEVDGHRYAIVPSPPQTSAHDACGDTNTDVDDGMVRQMHQLLTCRELQIVQLVCMGLLTKQIADRLHLSEFTVRSYLKTVYCKLGVRSRAAMVYRYAQAISQVPLRTV
jgi:DNA-binding CsgD family transcriptional regulator